MSSGFNRGRLYLPPPSFKRRRTVRSLILTRFLFSWFVISRLVTNVCCSASERIFWSCFGVVARGRPVRAESSRSFDCFHRLSQYCTVDMLHLTTFATDLCPSFGPNGYWDKKSIYTILMESSFISGKF